MSCIAVLVAGDPIPQVLDLAPNFGALIREIGGAIDVEWVEVDLRPLGRMPDPREFAACIVTGSPHSVTEQTPWILQAEAYLRRVRESSVGLFGICFGHQLMSSAFGGRVSVNPRGREMGLCSARPLSINSDLLCPSDPFEVLMSHRDTVSALPPGASVLAETDREAHAAVHHGELCYSTQFHPEFTPAVLKLYIEHYRQQMLEQGDDVDQLISRIRETPMARDLLRRFIHAALARDHRRIRRCAS
jgi:GMP synthase (glutamine-hydrolysing)